MSARVSSATLVAALRRRCEADGGNAMVLARGDDISGAVLLMLTRHGVFDRLIERGPAPDGGYRWVQAGPDASDDAAAVDAYLARRRKFDPDIWVVELDLPETPDWLDEMIGAA